MSETPKRRWSRYSLRTLFVAISLLAVLLSQYPYFWFMRTGERVITLDQDKDGNIVIRPIAFLPALLTFVVFGRRRATAPEVYQ